MPMETIIMRGKLARSEEENAPTFTIKRVHLGVAFAVCFLSVMFSGITSMLISVYLPVVAKDLLGDLTGNRMNNIAAFINSVFIFGSMFGGFAWGFICDKIGRSKSVILSTAVVGLFTWLTAFSSSWFMVSAIRFFTGFGVGGVLVTTNILVAELWPQKKRAVVLGIISVGVPLGFIFSGALNNMLTNWHQAFLTGMVPLVLAFVSVFTLTESAVWNTNKQAPAAAHTVSKKLFAPVYSKNLWTGSVIFGAMLIGLWAIFSWAPTWVNSIAAPALAQQQRGETMMVLAIGGLAGSIASGWIENAIGLRKTMMMCFAVCFIITFVVFKLNTAVSVATFAEMAVLAFFFGISQGALSVYIPQLFPTIVRASATGFCFNIGRLFTATAVFFIGALVSFLGGYGNAVFIFSFIFIAGLVATFFSKDEDEIGEKTASR